MANPLTLGKTAPTTLSESALQDHCDRLNSMGFVRHNSWKYFVGKRSLDNGEVVKFADRLESFDWA